MLGLGGQGDSTLMNHTFGEMPCFYFLTQQWTVLLGLKIRRRRYVSGSHFLDRRQPLAWPVLPTRTSMIKVLQLEACSIHLNPRARTTARFLRASLPCGPTRKGTDFQIKGPLRFRTMLLSGLLPLAMHTTAPCGRHVVPEISVR